MSKSFTEITVNRQVIRQIAELNSAELGEVSKAGGNIYQKSLDQKKELLKMIAHLSEEDQERFIIIYAEELDALSMAKLDEADKLNLEAIELEQSYQVRGEWIAAIIILIIGIALLSS